MSIERKIQLIVNTNAGGGKGHKKLVKILNAFEKYETIPDVCMAKSEEEGTKAAKEAAKNHDTVVAVGGDGTIANVVDAIAGSSAALGIIPVGTGNIFSFELGMGNNVKKAVKKIIENNTKLYDVGSVDSKHFLLWAGAGLDANIARETTRDLKEQWGFFAYAITLFKTLVEYEMPDIVVKDKDKEYRGKYVLIGNTRNYLRNVEVFPQGTTNDGLLDILIFKNADFIQLNKYLFGAITKTYPSLEGVEYFHTDKVSISGNKCPIHIDGTYFGEAPVEISVKKEYLKIIV